jgi:N-acetyltransferase 10
MIRPLENSNEGKEWLGAFSRDFDRRFLELLSYEFREFSSVLALSLDEYVFTNSLLS